MKDSVSVNNVLVSCYDKTGLKYFVSELAKLNPNVRFFASSGTFNELKNLVNVTEISAYTGTGEMPDGLVKTLHPKIHSGILADSGSQPHLSYLEGLGAVLFDMVVVNLYPFGSSRTGSIEKARTNMDIGGVSLIEAASKNFLRVSIVVSPIDYEKVLGAIRSSGGIDLKHRLFLARTALDYLAGYLSGISDYFSSLSPDDVRREYL